MKELLMTLSRKEKIGQMLQIAPFFFVKDLKVEVAGPVEELHLDEEKIFLAGSVLGIGNPNEMIEVQQKYLEKSRHKIPMLFMADIIHGYKTIFPVPIAMASSFSPKLAQACARVSALEASTSGIHVTFSPMADLSRDPRWGRVVEGFGEDPLLIGDMSAAMVKGYIGEGYDKPGTIASCVKHFAAYGAAEAGRDYNTVDMSRLSLYSTYLPSYLRALEAGARLVMTSFNTVDGVPCTVNPFLLREVLRDRWGSNAVTISDYDSLKQILAHGVAENMKEVAYRGVTGGLDIEMQSAAYANHLETLIEEGRVEEHLLDEAVLRILELKKDLGLFEDPYRGASSELADQIVLSEAHLAASLEVAKESAVLLENDGILPFNKETKIALIGPYATERNIIGPWHWHGCWNCHEHLAEAFADQTIFVKSDPSVESYSHADVQKILAADIVVLALGEKEWESGEAHSKSNPTLSKEQKELFSWIRRIHPKVVTLLFNGRPLILDDIVTSNALLECWFLGSMSSQAIRSILLGETNPSGKLPMSFPRNVGQIPIYYNHLNTGRPYLGEHDHNEYVSKYLDVKNTPQYPFGYGKSYSQFVYENLQVSKKVFSPTDILQVTVDVTNHSDRDGQEIVQLYLYDKVGRISRPVQELKRYTKVWIHGQEKKTIAFQLSEKDFSYVMPDGSTVLDSGEFVLYVGGSSNHTIETTITLKGTRA